MNFAHRQSLGQGCIGNEQERAATAMSRKAVRSMQTGYQMGRKMTEFLIDKEAYDKWAAKTFMTYASGLNRKGQYLSFSVSADGTFEVKKRKKLLYKGKSFEAAQKTFNLEAG